MACSKQFQLTIEDSACPALVATIAPPTPFVGVIAAKSPTNFRALISQRFSGPVQVLDTSNNTLAASVVDLRESGCYALVAERFVTFLTSNDNLVFRSASGGTLGGGLFTGNGFSSYPVYDPDSDLIYCASHDGGIPESFLEIMNPNAASAAVSHISTNIIGAGDIYNIIGYCPTPKVVLAAGSVGGGQEIHAYTLPGLVPAGTLSLGTNNFADNMVFAASTGKMYVTGIDALGVAIIMEVDPATMTLDFVYDTGGNFLSSAWIDYNPTTDRLYFVNAGDNRLLTINPVTRTIVCAQAIPAGNIMGPVSVNTAAQSIIAGDSLGNVLVFHH